MVGRPVRASTFVADAFVCSFGSQWDSGRTGGLLWGRRGISGLMPIFQDSEWRIVVPTDVQSAGLPDRQPIIVVSVPRLTIEILPLSG